MNLAAWSDDFLLGMKQVDDNHRRLFQLIQIINEEFARDTRLENLMALLNALLSLSKFDFNCEERWLAEIGFPSLAEHKEEHVLFISTIAEIQRSYPHTNDANGLLLFLNNWINSHFDCTNRTVKFFISTNKAGI